jgi:hypothetical protein
LYEPEECADSTLRGRWDALPESDEHCAPASGQKVLYEASLISRPTQPPVSDFDGTAQGSPELRAIENRSDLPSDVTRIAWLRGLRRRCCAAHLVDERGTASSMNARHELPLAASHALHTSACIGTCMVRQQASPLSA